MRVWALGAVLFLLPLSALAGVSPQIVSGDVNGDGIADALDLDDLATEVFDGDPEAADAAGLGAFEGDPGGDANVDGRITAADFVATVLIVGTEPIWQTLAPLPAPRQEVGVAALGDLVYVVADSPHKRAI